MQDPGSAKKEVLIQCSQKSHYIYKSLKTFFFPSKVYKSIYDTQHFQTLAGKVSQVCEFFFIH